VNGRPGRSIAIRGCSLFRIEPVEIPVDNPGPAERRVWRVSYFLAGPLGNRELRAKIGLKGLSFTLCPASGPSAADEYFSVGLLNLDSLLSSMNKGSRVSINSRTESMPGGMHG